jgi:hypothetical protein
VQRFCPCVAVGEVGQCGTTPDPIETPDPSGAPAPPPTAAPTGCFVWLLGRAGSSCDTTCDSVGGTCNEAEMIAASGQSDLEEILTIAYAQDSAIHPVETASYCTYLTAPPMFFFYVPHLYALNLVFATNRDDLPENHCYWATPALTEADPCTTPANGGFYLNPFCACNVPLCSTWENALDTYSVSRH